MFSIGKCIVQDNKNISDNSINILISGNLAGQWLSAELLSLFLFHEMRPLGLKEEAHIIKSLVRKHYYYLFGNSLLECHICRITTNFQLG